jgi:N-acetylmuramic acid 6-phosphate etherase
MSDLTTESRNDATMHLDEMTIKEILETMNDEDQKVPQEIRKVFLI